MYAYKACKTFNQIFKFLFILLYTWVELVKTAASLPFIKPRQANAVTHRHIAPRLLKTYPAVKDKEYKESFNAVTVLYTCMSKIS